jgi:FAD/FMN-containing dehydrogenase
VRLLGLLDSRLGGTLSAFEAMWPEFYETTTSKATPNAPLLPYGAGMYGIVESLGADPGADEARLEQALADAFEAGMVTDAVIAKSEAERRAIWGARENPWLVGQQHGFMLNFDISVAIGDMEPYLEKLRAAVTQRVAGARVFRFGHIADSNLHVIVVPGSDDVAIHREIEALVYGLLREFDGSISAEHGIGLERLHFLDITRTQAEIAAMRALKATLDPNGILNPGKMFALNPGG